MTSGPAGRPGARGGGPRGHGRRYNPPMQRMRTAFVLGCALWALLPAGAGARGWQGVVPGATTEAEVSAKFGAPSTQGKLGGRNALVYKGEQAIAGTRQAQFFTRGDGVVAEVVVFPAAQLDREAVEGTYGHPTKKAFTEDFRSVWLFRATGTTVFFGKDGLVEAISFKAPEAERGAEPARAPEPKAPRRPAAPAEPGKPGE